MSYLGCNLPDVAFSSNRVVFVYSVSSINGNHYDHDLSKTDGRIRRSHVWNFIIIILYYCTILQNHDDFNRIHSAVRTLPIVYDEMYAMLSGVSVGKERL